MKNFIKRTPFRHKKELEKLKAGQKFIELDKDQFAIVDYEIKSGYYIFDGLRSLDYTLRVFVSEKYYKPSITYCQNNTYLLETK